MHIQLNNFAIVNYNPEDLKHVKFVKDMKEANDEFLYNCIDQVIKKSASSEKIHIGYGYIIEEKENLIGFFRPARKVDDNILIDLGVHPNYRYQGYGVKILNELTDFFFQFTDINCISGNVDAKNETCIKCAKKAGFTEVEEKYPRQFIKFIKRK